VATILARAAAQDTSLLSLLDPDTEPGPAAQQMRNKWLLESGAELSDEDLVIKAPARRRTQVVPQELASRQVVPKQVRARVKANRSEEHTSELQSRFDLVCRLL